MSRTESAMETPQPSSTPVRESELRNRVACRELPFSGLFNVCGMQWLVESPSGYSLVWRFQIGLTFAPMELMVTTSALCDIEVEISYVKSPHSVRSHAFDDCSGRVSCNRRELSTTGEPLHDPGARVITRLWDADLGSRNCPLARSCGVAAAW
jgi:hypothetical protein